MEESGESEYRTASPAQPAAQDANSTPFPSRASRESARSLKGVRDEPHPSKSPRLKAALKLEEAPPMPPLPPASVMDAASSSYGHLPPRESSVSLGVQRCLADRVFALRVDVEPDMNPFFLAYET